MTDLITNTLTIGTFSDVRCQTRDWWRGFASVVTAFPQYEAVIEVPSEFVMFTGCVEWVLRFDSIKYIKIKPDIYVAVRFDYRDTMLGVIDAFELLERYVGKTKLISYSSISDVDRYKLIDIYRARNGYHINSFYW